MPPKTGLVSNIVESINEQTRVVRGDVKRQLDPRDTLRLYVDPDHKFKTKEEIKAEEEQEIMRKIDGYKDIFRKIDAIEGRVTDEEKLDEKVRKYIEEEKKKAIESFREMKIEHKAQASQLGAPAHGEEQKEYAEKQRVAQEEEEEKKKKAEEQAKLETQIEAPPGKQTGLSFRGKRKSSPRRGTPRATENLRRGAEQRVGSGIGG
jgi:hypothetical protein